MVLVKGLMLINSCSHYSPVPGTVIAPPVDINWLKKTGPCP